MPSESSLIAFVSAALVLIAVPGPNMIYLVACSVSGGGRAGVRSALGIETGTLLHTTAAAIGLSALLASSATAFAVVRYLGAAYLVYLGGRSLIGRHEPLTDDADRPAKRGRTVYRQALLTQVLNPKVAIFFLAFLPQFVDPARPAAPQILTLGVILAVMGMAIGTTVALSAGALSRRLQTRRRGGRPWARRASGATYLALGVYAAVGPGHRFSTR